ncbi:hypothetical protein F2Q68_00043663 [Brassica cretica]|uniref:Uncharacterized protein n=1 Tax=Brassica cretica TaxID=69181 RepID=A0A8S9LSI3_BRACR|nr:hypothetical protein F2Q68_00043663 [Brassica cretica]
MFLVGHALIGEENALRGKEIWVCVSRSWVSPPQPAPPSAAACSSQGSSSTNVCGQERDPRLMLMPRSAS